MRRCAPGVIGALALALGLALTPSARADRRPAPVADPGCVVLLHGLARGTGSWRLMAHALERAGFQVVNQGYPSTSATVQDLVPVVSRGVAACAKRGGPVHIITHSMGAILYRAWRGQGARNPLGRVVMLAPPNRGSQLVDRLGDLAPFGWINGPAGRQLGTGRDALPARLGPVRGDRVGVIAGYRSLNPLYSALIPGPDDGKVALAATRLAGAADQIDLPVTHTFLMNNRAVIAQTIHFLRDGRFSRAPDPIAALDGGLGSYWHLLRGP